MPYPAPVPAIALPSTQIGAYADLSTAFPAPIAGDTYIFTDGPLSKAIFNGSAWQHFCGDAPVTLLTFSDWTTWVNQGSATSTTSNGALEIKAPVSSGYNLRGLVCTIAAGDFDVVFTTLPPVTHGFNSCGFLGLYEVASGKISGFLVGQASADYAPGIYNLTGVSAAPSLQAYMGRGATQPAPTFWRITRVGTTISYYLSHTKGADWNRIFSASEATLGFSGVVDRFFFGVNTNVSASNRDVWFCVAGRRNGP